MKTSIIPLTSACLFCFSISTYFQSPHLRKANWTPKKICFVIFSLRSVSYPPPLSPFIIFTNNPEALRRTHKFAPRSGAKKNFTRSCVSFTNSSAAGTALKRLKTLHTQANRMTSSQHGCQPLEERKTSNKKTLISSSMPSIFHLLFVLF